MRELLGERLLSTVRDVNVVTEFRLRVGQETLIKTLKGDYYCAFRPTEKDIGEILKKAMRFSPYAYENELSAGYVPYKNGIRIGIAGKGKLNADKKILFSNVRSLCVRIPHEIVGCSDKLGDYFSDFVNTVVISPPYCGKTTLIRDMARVLSDRYDTLYIDERYELCGETLSLSVGKKADVIQGVEKKYLYENVIRAMAPEIVVCDELFCDEDFFAVKRFFHAGIKCLASFHAPSIDRLPPIGKEIFNKYIVLCDKPFIGTIAAMGYVRA